MPTYGYRKNRRSTKGSSTLEHLHRPPAHRPPARRSPPRRGRPLLALLRRLRRPGARPPRHPRLGSRRHPGSQRPLDEPGRPRLRRLAPRRPRRLEGGILWQIRVHPTEGDPWAQEFGPYTPSEAVAGFIAALVAQR
ncbi:DUF317 domain-containing protein [Streptomyces sp. NBC_01471]|uniref:DUF317 domain-containing protein n=1 Tax=Streptomyces sp. NBC_01471 TaxID=2903879 RepID=UPI00324B2F75